MNRFPDHIIRIHGITGARSACRVMGARPFVLLSPEKAALSHGAQWFADLIKLISEEFPDSTFTTILDCRGRVSGALTAIEIGLDGVIVDPLPDDPVDRLQDMGRQARCTVMTELPPQNAIYEMRDDLLPDGELDRRLQEYLGDA